MTTEPTSSQTDAPSPKEIIYPEVKVVKPQAESVSPETLQLLSKHYTDQFWTGVNKTNTALLAWCAAMLLILFSVVIPLSEELSRAEKKFKGIEKLSAKRDAAMNPKQVIEEGKQGAQLAKLQKGLAVTRLEQEIKEEKTKLKETLQRVEDLPLPSPLNKIKISTSYVPMVWTFLFTGLVAFILYRRVVLLAMLVQIVHIQVIERKKRIRELRGLASGVPFWLAPMPRVVPGASISADELRKFNKALRQYLGWRLAGGSRHRSMFLCLAAALILYLWVAWVVFRLDKIVTDSYLPTTAVIFALVCCVVACVLWLRPQIRFGGYPEMLLRRSKERRAFLLTAGTGIALGLTYILIPPRLLHFLNIARSPRFTRRKDNASAALPENLRQTFQLNNRSRVVHYIGGDGLTSERVSLSPQSLAPIEGQNLIQTLTVGFGPDAYQTKGDKQPAGNTASPSTQNEVSRPVAGSVETETPASPATPKAQAPHFPAGKVGTLTEPLALDQAVKGNTPLALQMLWDAIHRDTSAKQNNKKAPDYRLYELVAGLAYRAAPAEALNTFTTEVEKLRQHLQKFWPDNLLLGQRLQMWNKPSDRWKSRWKSTELAWKLPPKAKEASGAPQK